MKKIIIFPYNGNGLEALDCLGGEFELIGFADDTTEKQGKTPFGFEVYSRDIFGKYKESFVLAVPGGPLTYMLRQSIISQLKIEEVRFARVIHPNASVSSLSKIGYNTLLMAGVVITSTCIIENHVCVLPNSVIHHDCRIGEYSLLGSNVTIAGGSIIGKNCYLGSGSKIINGIEIGNNSLVGLSSNVIRSVPENSKVVGNPARKI
jgi:sugar O-acyltransferase (sialic acid O-acetyltransferase NeuD family)